MGKKLTMKVASSYLLKYVEELRGYDHAFLSPEGADHFSLPFGFRAQTWMHQADGHINPKGLTLNDGATQAEGIAAHQLAEQICDHVDIKYVEKFGRGSQLRSCCDALEQWLKSND